jgi:hypothetical protein
MDYEPFRVSYTAGQPYVGATLSMYPPNGLGHQVVQESQPFGHNLSRQKIDAGRVAAWPAKAGDQTKPDRVFGDAEDNRYRRGGSFGREGTSGEARCSDRPHDCGRGQP